MAYTWDFLWFNPIWPAATWTLLHFTASASRAAWWSDGSWIRNGWTQKSIKIYCTNAKRMMVVVDWIGSDGSGWFTWITSGLVKRWNQQTQELGFSCWQQNLAWDITSKNQKWCAYQQQTGIGSLTYLLYPCVPRNKGARNSQGCAQLSEILHKHLSACRLNRWVPLFILFKDTITKSRCELHEKT